MLQMAPMSFFGSLVTILSPHLGQPISKVTHTVADLGEAEAVRIWKERRPVTHKKNLQGPMKVMRTQMWVDLIWAGADGRKLDGKPNRILLHTTMATAETRAAVPAIKTKEAELRDRATGPVCVLARLPAGE